MKLIPAVTLVLWSAGVAAQSLAMQEAGAIQWACGGAGADARAELARLEAQANLMLSFVTVKRGGYVADVAVSIVAENAKLPRFDVTSDGPICLLRVPPGRYRIEASFGATRRAATTMVAKDGKRPGRLVFAFPGKTWDGIWASDEEKRQAREP